MIAADACFGEVYLMVVLGSLPFRVFVVLFLTHSSSCCGEQGVLSSRDIAVRGNGKIPDMAAGCTAGRERFSGRGSRYARDVQLFRFETHTNGKQNHLRHRRHHKAIQDLIQRLNPGMVLRSRRSFVPRSLTPHCKRLRRLRRVTRLPTTLLELRKPRQISIRQVEFLRLPLLRSLTLL